MVEPVFIEPFVSEFSVKAFDVSILGRFAGLDDPVINFSFVGPLVHVTATERGAVVGKEALWLSV